MPPKLKPIGQVSSQQGLQPSQTVYLRQTDPIFTAALPSKFGGLDNTTYAKGDILAHSGSAFYKVPLADTGSVLLSDLSQLTGTRWSVQLLRAQQDAATFISKIADVTKISTDTRDDLASINAGIYQCNLDKQQLTTNFTTLSLYVADQKSNITQVTVLMDSVASTITAQLNTISTINNEITTFQNQLSQITGVKDANRATLDQHNNTIQQTQTQLSLLGGSDVGAINRLINGDFTVWQRGTTYTGAAGSQPNYVTADRWWHSNTHGGTLTSTRITATLPSSGIYNASQSVNGLQVNVAGGGPFKLATAIEEPISQTVTVNLWLKADSAVSIVPSIVQRPSTGASGDNTVTGNAFAITTTWTRFSSTFNLTAQTNGQITIVQFEGPSWPNVQLAKVQLQYGAQSLEFEEKNIQVDLMLCRRYYESGYDYFNGYANAYSNVSAFHQYTTEKRVPPTLTLTSVGQTGFLDPLVIGIVNNTLMGSSMRQKNNRFEVGYFSALWKADAEIYI